MANVAFDLTPQRRYTKEKAYHQDKARRDAYKAEKRARKALRSVNPGSQEARDSQAMDVRDIPGTGERRRGPGRKSRKRQQNPKLLAQQRASGRPRNRGKESNQASAQHRPPGNKKSTPKKKGNKGEDNHSDTPSGKLYRLIPLNTFHAKYVTIDKIALFHLLGGARVVGMTREEILKPENQMRFWQWYTKIPKNLFNKVPGKKRFACMIATDGYGASVLYRWNETSGKCKRGRKPRKTTSEQ